MSKKEKKEKVVYIDDGRTIADMSAFGEKKPREPQVDGWQRARDIWHTYWTATKMMLLPTLACMGAMTVIFALMYVLFRYAG